MEFTRCVTSASPEWWLLENVPTVPDIIIPGYVTQRIDINSGWYCDQTRLRHIQFGSLSGRLLNIPRHPVTGTQPAVLANDTRSFRRVCELQGLPDDYDLPPFRVKEAIRAVGNGVPLPMGRELARAVTTAYVTDLDVTLRICECGCGRPVTGKQKYYDYSCRKRAQRKRDQAQSRHSCD